MTLIQEAGEIAAVVGRTRAYLLPYVEDLPEADPLRRRVLAKCLLGIATGRRLGPTASSRRRRSPAGAQAGRRDRRAGSGVWRVPV